MVKCKGDNDPVDVVEIGSTLLPTGSISQVGVGWQGRRGVVG